MAMKPTAAIRAWLSSPLLLPCLLILVIGTCSAKGLPSPEFDVDGHGAGHGDFLKRILGSEDEFVEQLEKLLRTGASFKERQKAYHSAAATEQKALVEEPKDQQVVQSPGKLQGIGHEQHVIITTQKTVPSEAPTVRQQVAPKPQETAKANKPPAVVGVSIAGKTFAFKPREHGYWRESEENKQLRPTPPVQEIQNEQETAHSGDQSDYIKKLEQELRKKLNNIRPLERPINNVEGLASRLEEVIPNAREINLHKFGFDFEAAENHPHGTKKLPEQKPDHVNHKLPTNLHPQDFSEVETALSRQQISKKQGQKEIVTYIDIPKMVAIEEMNNKVQAANLAKKEKEGTGKSPVVSSGEKSGKEISEEGRLGKLISNLQVKSDGHSGLQLDIGDHKVHWLQPAHGQEGSVEDEELLAPKQIKNSEEESHGPKALKLVRRPEKDEKKDPMSHFYFVGAVAGCSAAVAFGVIAAGVFWLRLKKNAKAAEDTDYPAYGITGPGRHGGSSSHDVSPTSGDRKLAQSAQMYHYQHQKQQMIAMENHGNNSHRRIGSTSDAEESDEEENEEGDYTVYECPGLAPTGEMEVRNPLFQDDPMTPGSPRRSIHDDLGQP